MVIEIVNSENAHIFFHSHMFLHDFFNLIEYLKTKSLFIYSQK